MSPDSTKTTCFTHKLLTCDLDVGVVDSANRRLSRHHHFRYHLNSLSVEHKKGRLTITGRLPSFYLKQLLQTVLRTLPEIKHIDNRVDVVSCQGLSSVSHLQERNAKP
jgi:hypothetical protein